MTDTALTARAVQSTADYQRIFIIVLAWAIPTALSLVALWRTEVSNANAEFYAKVQTRIELCEVLGTREVVNGPQTETDIGLESLNTDRVAKALIIARDLGIAVSKGEDLHVAMARANTNPEWQVVDVLTPAHDGQKALGRLNPAC